MSISEKTFILFNNRSRKLVMRFLVPHDLAALNELEGKIAWVSSRHTYGRTVEISANELVDTDEDILYWPEDVASCVRAIESAHESLLAGGDELAWLEARGIGRDTIEKYMLGALSSVPDDCLDFIGASCHPMLSKLLNAERGPGILIPLMREGKLVNVTTRRIDDMGKLKYTQAVPDIDVWGLGSLRKGKRVYIAEGLFDMMALHSIGLSAVSVSSAMWSGPQMLKLVGAMRAHRVGATIVADNDQPGLRCARVIQRVLAMEGFETDTVICGGGAKDPSEMIFEMGLSEFEPVSITRDMVECAADTSFNFTNYLKNRKF